MTRSGWIFVAPKLSIWSKDKGKAKADIGERDKANLTPNDEVPVGKITEEGDDFSKKEISVEEATEFLRIIQQSEFKVIEQLNKTPAKISLHIHIPFMPKIHTPQVFKQHKSNKDNNFIHQQ